MATKIKRGVKRKPNIECASSRSEGKGAYATRVFVEFLVFLIAYESVLFFSGESLNILEHGGDLLQVVGDAPELLMMSLANSNSAPSQHSSSLVLDILTVGSNTRRDLLKAQTETWAMPHTGIIRNVHQANEDDDCDQVCRNGTFTRDQVEQVRLFCRKMLGRNSWYMRRNIYMKFLGGDKDPGWVCAQKRPILALVKILRGYIHSAGGDIPMPDYLLLVDDDTWYNVDKLANILRAKNSSAPYVAAGCKTVHSKRHTVYHGGMGLVLSRGSLERLMRPLPDNNQGADINGGWEQQWEAHVHEKLVENLAFEKDLFSPGMSLMDLMDAYVRAEPYDNVDQWTRGYCFHSDNFLSYIMEHYWIHGESSHNNAERSHDEIMNVLFPPVQEVHDITHYGLCVLKGGCPADSTACHYQTPANMYERTNQVLADRRQVKSIKS